MADTIKVPTEIELSNLLDGAYKMLNIPQLIKIREACIMKHEANILKIDSALSDKHYTVKDRCPDSQPIDDFHRDWAFLSNFYPCEVHVMKMTFPSVENAYQAGKSVDYDTRLGFTHKQITAAIAKKLGRKLEIRDDWEEVKDEIMMEALKYKFSPFHPDKLFMRLIDTYPRPLTEGNYWHDTYWGQCTCEAHANTGLNKLGKFLMQIREELINGAGTTTTSQVK